MRIFIIVIFLAYLILEYVNLKCNQRSKKVLFIIHLFLLLSLVLMAGYRDGFRYADYGIYVSAFYYGNDTMEFSFHILSDIANRIDHGNYYVLFLLYALLGVFLKSIGIWRMSSFPYASMAMYVSFFYILHELIQIRVGVASAIGLIALGEIYNKNLFRFLLLIALAACFHASALFYILFYFIDCRSFDRNKWIIYGILLASCSILIFSWILPHISFDFAYSKLVEYTQRAELGIDDQAQITGTYYTIQYILLILYIWFAGKLSLCNKYTYLLLKILIIGYALRLAFYTFNPILGIRLSELCLIVELILFPVAINLFKQKSLGILFVAFIGIINIISAIYLRGYVPN